MLPEPEAPRRLRGRRRRSRTGWPQAWWPAPPGLIVALRGRTKARAVVHPSRCNRRRTCATRLRRSRERVQLCRRLRSQLHENRPALVVRQDPRYIISGFLSTTFALCGPTPGRRTASPPYVTARRPGTNHDRSDRSWSRERLRREHEQGSVGVAAHHRADDRQLVAGDLPGGPVAMTARPPSWTA
jgi:hypothetical protein